MEGRDEGREERKGGSEEKGKKRKKRKGRRKHMGLSVQSHTYTRIYTHAQHTQVHPRPVP